MVPVFESLIVNSHSTKWIIGKNVWKLKGQLQRFQKLSLFDRFRHVENGFDINF